MTDVVSTPIRRMTPEEYLAWEAEQEHKHELVDGVPVRRWPVPEGGTEMMAGATNRHSRICENLSVALGARLRGGPCRTYSSDTKLAVPAGGYRYPDKMIVCGPVDPRSMFAPTPRVVLEVISRSNTWTDQVERLDDYRSIPSVEAIVFLDQVRPRARIWRRVPDGWRESAVEGLEAELALDAVDVAAPLAEIYEGVEFDDA